MNLGKELTSSYRTETQWPLSDNRNHNTWGLSENVTTEMGSTCYSKSKQWLMRCSSKLHRKEVEEGIPINTGGSDIS